MAMRTSGKQGDAVMLIIPGAILVGFLLLITGGPHAMLTLIERFLESGAQAIADWVSQLG